MPKMADLIKAQGSAKVPFYVPGEMTPEHKARAGQLHSVSVADAEFLKNHPESMPIFDVTNVNDFINDKTIDIYKDWPCLTSPFETCWLEYARRSNFPAGVAVAVTQFLLSPNKDGSETADRMIFMFKEYPEQVKAHARWILGFTLYFMQDRKIIGPVGLFHVALDAQGAPLEFQYETADFEDEQLRRMGLTNQEFFLRKIAPFYQAMAFMNVRNVVTVGNKPESKLSHKWQRKRGAPLVSWSTLQIDTVKNAVKRERGEATEIPKSLHIARGHFAEYGPEFNKGKLFGKYSGRFWIPAHVRGTQAAGAVLHDYEIKGDQL